MSTDKINPDHYKHLPVEAIEIIEAAIAKAPSNKAAYLQGQVLKYVLRCWRKGGFEDVLKAKWYLDRLIDSARQSDLQSLKEHPLGEPTDPQLPDGWRWLEEGEGFMPGDTTATSDGKPYFPSAITQSYIATTRCNLTKTFIRRNRFEVGERVVDIGLDRIGVIAPCTAKVYGSCIYRVEMLDTKNERHFFPHQLAPYIEASE